MRILAYHAIADLSEDPVLAEYAVPERLFAEHLAALAADGWSFVGLGALLDARRGKVPLKERSLLVTFDDCYADLLDSACPILAERGVPAVAFPVTDEIGGSNSWDQPKGAARLDLLDADGLLAIAEHGVEIGSHTASHCKLPSIPPEQMGAELVGSADRIESLGLPRPRVFSYPYGEWTPQIAGAVRDSGYEAAVTVEWGAVGEETDLFALPRVEVHASDTPRKLKRKLALADFPGLLRDSLLRLSGVRLDPSAK